MPIYEYQCQKCGHQLEKRQSISDKPLSRCPICKGKLEKQWSQTSFQLKGSGWYVTDYAGKKSGKSESKAESGEPKTAARDDKSSTSESGDGKADSKASDTAKSTEAKPKGKRGSSKSAD